ncbi:hypothetical protein [Robertmurraya siralis]|uniref:hypothetical protein n=1 Tax=Robertmurraya siralis TaxID=77777 RepID=UPI0010F88133|nr:hypothetical protein [Robertmurraya siralis]
MKRNHGFGLGFQKTYSVVLKKLSVVLIDDRINLINVLNSLLLQSCFRDMLVRYIKTMDVTAVAGAESPRGIVD